VATATGLELEIRAVNGTRAGLQAAVRDVQSGGQAMSRALDEVTGASQRSASGQASLADAARNFAREQRQQGRVARFYAGEIASIIPVSREAKTALQGLAAVGIEGLAGGLGIGVAIESVKLLAEWFNHAREEAKRLRDEEVKKIEESLKSGLDYMRQQTRELRVQQAVRAGQSPEAARAAEEVRERKSERDAVQHDLDAKQKEVDEARARRNEEVRKARAHLAEVAGVEVKDTEQYADRMAAAIPAARGFNAVAAEQTPLVEKLGVAFDALGTGIDAAVESARVLSAEIPKITVETKPVGHVVFTPPGAKEGLTSEELAGVRKAATPGFETGALDDWRKALEETDRLEEEFAARRKERADKFRADLDAATAAGSKAGSVIGTSLANAFGQGKKGARAFFLTMLDQVIATVQAKAVEGAATAAAAHAWALPVAAASATATFALIRGLLAQLPGRAFGGEVEAGRTYVVGERGPEPVTFGQAGRVGSFAQSRGGEAPVVVNVHALDGPSVYRVLRSNPREVARALRDLARDGVYRP
jgi:hypothetical protein